MESDPYCRLCSKQCNSLAGNPGKWPVHLGNDYDAHISCVNEWLDVIRVIGRKLSEHGIVVNVRDMPEAIDQLAAR
jgi:hypothetical protein